MSILALSFSLIFFFKVGAAFPIWGLLLASVENMFYLDDIQELRNSAALAATRFIMLGICCLIGYTLQYYCIAQVGQRISTGRFMVLKEEEKEKE